MGICSERTINWHGFFVLFNSFIEMVCIFILQLHGHVWSFMSEHSFIKMFFRTFFYQRLFQNILLLKFFSEHSSMYIRVAALHIPGGGGIWPFKILFLSWAPSFLPSPSKKIPNNNKNKKQKNKWINKQATNKQIWVFAQCYGFSLTLLSQRKKLVSVDD